MDNITTILIIVAAAFGVFLALALLIPYLVKRGINLSGVLGGTNTALYTADFAVDSLKELFPNSPALTIADKIIGWAQKGAEAAEQLYKASQIEAEDRKAEATKLVYDIIRMAQIEITPEVESIVNGCIEAAVYVLPKSLE